MLNFNFLEKNLGIVSPPHYVYNFFKKVFLILYFLTDKLSLTDSIYLLRFWEIRLLQLFDGNKFWN